MVNVQYVYLDPKNVRFNDLRHTAASRLLEQGENVEMIRQFLGHSDISTTQRYLHIGSNQVSIAATGMLDALLRGVKDDAPKLVEIQAIKNGT